MVHESPRKPFFSSRRFMMWERKKEKKKKRRMRERKTRGTEGIPIIGSQILFFEPRAKVESSERAHNKQQHRKRVDANHVAWLDCVAGFEKPKKPSRGSELS